MKEHSNSPPEGKPNTDFIQNGSGQFGINHFNDTLRYVTLQYYDVVNNLISK